MLHGAMGCHYIRVEDRQSATIFPASTNEVPYYENDDNDEDGNPSSEDGCSRVDFQDMKSTRLVDLRRVDHLWLRFRDFFFTLFLSHLVPLIVETGLSSRKQFHF